MTTDSATLQGVSQQEARQSIEALFQGQPPSPAVTDFISVGIDRDLKIFEREYFRSDALLPNSSQGTFKIVEAYYGGGKTHYLRAIERTAHRHGFASTFVELHKDSCPLTRLDLIYAKVVEGLTVPDGSGGLSRGIGDVIRAWVSGGDEDEDPIERAMRQVGQLGDLPLPSVRIALRDAALAVASNDRDTLDEILVYLHGGKISSALRKRGVMEVIDVKSGALALRTLAHWLRQIGYPGLVVIMDEGDRSLSIASSNDRKAASNNLVQLINETLAGNGWPGVMLLYSIPGWDHFQNAFSGNQALDQRVKNTGFPKFPPAPRIVLDDRFQDDEDKLKFCHELGERLQVIFAAAYPSDPIDTEDAESAARIVARVVVDQVADVSFRRLFVQSYLAGLYQLREGDEVTERVAREIVAGTASKMAG
jgi:hypothetical protein